MRSQEPIKIISQNRRAYFDYAVEENFECGIVLQGSEVKSIKEGRVSFGDAFAEIKGQEVWLNNFHIAEYPHASMLNHDPDRPRSFYFTTKRSSASSAEYEKRATPSFPYASI